MGYNKHNLYRRAAKVQDIVLKGQKRGDTQLMIYYNEIEPVYHISLRTFYYWLAMPAKLRLEKLKSEEKRQTVLPF